MTPTDPNPHFDEDAKQQYERVLALAQQSERAQLLRSRFPEQFEEVQQLYYGDGWHGLVTRACELAAVQPFGVRWFQIKEKFGALRLHADFVNVRDDRESTMYRMTFQDFLVDIQADSERTCQACGSPGSRMRVAAVMTLCERCGTTLKAIPLPLTPQGLERRGQL